MVSTISPPNVPSADPSLLRGAQRPRIHLHPDYVSSAGREAIECAALAGLHLDPWEQLVLIDGLGERADGRWAAFEVGLEAPRQNGKGSTLEARELAGAFAFGEKLIIHSAHEQLTSSEHFRRMLNLIEGVPEFDRRVMKVVKGKGSEAIELRDGQRIFFKTRTGGGGRGLTGDLVVLDEAMILPVATTAALVPTMAARSITGNPQLWYAGSAVDQEKHEHGVVFTRLRLRALAGAASMAYFGWSADVRAWLEAHGLRFDPKRSEIEQITPEMLADPEMWAQANPGLGIRISHEHISLEHGGALGRREFAVERLGIPDPPDVSEDSGRVIAREVWARSAESDPSNRITSRPVFSLDVNPDQTWASIGVGGKRADGRLQGAVVAHERDTDWILPHFLGLKSNHSGMQVVIDKRSTAGAHIDPLIAAGIKVIEIGTEEYTRACTEFVKAVSGDQFRYPSPQPELDEALANARKASVGDAAWKWSRKDSASADITPIVSVTLAAYGVTHAKPRARVINPYDFV